MSGSDKPRSMLAGRHGHRRSGKQLLSNNSVNEKLNSRRMQFFSSGARMTDEELAERDEQRKASIESVRKAIEAASIVDPIRPLRRFQCKLLVALHYHSTTKAGKAKLTRCQAVMVDSTPFSKFAQWAALQLEIKEEKAKTLTFQYFNDSGRGVRVDKQQALQQWLDASWARHPLHMHVYSVESLVVQAEDRAELMSEMFNEYDLDRSGTIEPFEMREMLMRLQIAQNLEISREDYANFVAEEVAAADANNDGVITRAEFEAYYNQLQDYVKDALSNKNRYEHTVSRFRRAYAEARSYRRTLGDWVNNFNGIVKLDSLGHDYHVTVHFPKSCMGEDNSGEWVRAQTLLESAVDHFEDATSSLGALMTPIVQVEFEGFMELHDNYVVTFPHSFDYCEEGKLFDKADVVMVFSTFDAGFWHAIDPSSWEMLFPDEAAGRPYPSFRVTMPDEGIVCAFARTGRKVDQRVQCLAYLPEKVIPLEIGILHLHIVAALPDQIELARHNERLKRGNVVLGCISQVQSVRKDTSFEISLAQRETEKHAIIWDCETPEGARGGAQRRAGRRAGRAAAGAA
mgnify:CR=1 FL=1